MRHHIGEIKRPALEPAEVNFAFNNNLTEGALAAIIISEAQAGWLHIRERVIPDDSQNEQPANPPTTSYRVSINQQTYLDKANISPLLDCLLLKTNLALDHPWDMPPPPTPDTPVPPPQPGGRWSLLAIAGGVVEGQLQEKGYTRPMVNLRVDSTSDYARWAWPAAGVIAGASTYFAGTSAQMAVGIGVSMAATSGIKRKFFPSSKACVAESLDTGRFTPQGKSAVAEVKLLHIAMQAMVADDVPLPARTCHELLPYQPILQVENWLGTTACQQAFRRPPHWLKPLRKRESGAEALQKLINFCMESAWQPGEIHLRGRLSAGLIRQQACGVAQQGQTRLE